MKILQISVIFHKIPRESFAITRESRAIPAQFPLFLMKIKGSTSIQAFRGSFLKSVFTLGYQSRTRSFGLFMTSCFLKQTFLIVISQIITFCKCMQRNMLRILILRDLEAFLDDRAVNTCFCDEHFQQCSSKLH